MKGISSVYGFILIFLLSMASIQTWSSAVGAMESIQGASDQSHQVQQLQGLEHLSLSLSGSNLTIRNDGQVPSTVDFLRLLKPNSSRTVPVALQLQVGESVYVPVSAASSIEAVTALGDVFVLSLASDPSGSVWSAPIGSGALSNTQVFGNPYDPSLLYVSSGASVYALTASGDASWTFDAGAGTVTDVLPLSDGTVFVSVNYGYPSNDGILFELDRTGAQVGAYSIRTADSPPGPSTPVAMPVQAGEDSTYAYYDGWFYGPAGPSGSLSSGQSLLAATGNSSFYTYSFLGGSTYGACLPWGNEEVIDSYSPDANVSGGVLLNWTAFAYLGPCTRYDPQLVAASVGGGALVQLFAAPYFSSDTVQSLPGYNPYLSVLSTSGLVLYDGKMPSNGYTSVATDGSRVFLALPSQKEVQVLSITTKQVRAYDVGFPASGLLFEHGLLFAISANEVRVYDGSMSPVKTIALAPLALASYSNPPDYEPALQSPSFLVLNSTTYAALEENSTGFASLTLGTYA
jgi:hypothetical protein